MGRAPCCDKAKVKKGPWSPDEDTKLKSHIQIHGTGGNWIALPNKIGLKRCGKSCRLRWLNYLRPNLKHGGFTADEDNLICTLYLSIGSRWSVIASQLPGRTDNDIKNYWNTRLKKKLFAKQRRSSTAANTLPPPPPPSLADHALNIEQSFSYFNNFEANFLQSAQNQSVWANSAAYDTMPQLLDAAAGMNSSENVISEDMNYLTYYYNPPYTNYQVFDEASHRLLPYSQ